MTKIIAITGGIGAGKSVISKVLLVNGFSVYDCDREAKKLMDKDTAIHSRIVSEIHPKAIQNGVINRQFLSDIVFNDSEKLNRLNSIVHSSVLDDIKKESTHKHNHNVLFVESAILYQSNLDKIANQVWEVIAPIEIRIQRVQKRNKISRDKILARINAQDSYTPGRIHEDTRIIINDDSTPLLPQVLDLVEQIKFI